MQPFSGNRRWILKSTGLYRDRGADIWMKMEEMMMMMMIDDDDDGDECRWKRSI